MLITHPMCIMKLFTKIKASIRSCYPFCLNPPIVPCPLTCKIKHTSPGLCWSELPIWPHPYSTPAPITCSSLDKPSRLQPNGLCPCCPLFCRYNSCIRTSLPSGPSLNSVSESCLLSVTPWPVWSFLCPWDSPGKNTGVGGHALLRGSSWSRDLTWFLGIAGKFFTVWGTRETHLNIKK